MAIQICTRWCLFPQNYIIILFRILFTALQATESEDQQRLRFQVELEFVQCLANPNYLHCESA